MKRALIILSSAVIMAGAATGCVPKEDKSNVSIDPDFSEPDTIEFDFIELNNTTIANFGTVANTPYTFISAVSIDGSNDDKSITADITAVDGTEESDAEHFAAALLRHMDDAAADQYTTIEESSEKSFGTLYDDYSVTITIKNEDDDSEIYKLELKAGDEITLDPDIEAYEEEWKEYGDLYQQGQIDEESQYQEELDAEEAAEAAETADSAEETSESSSEKTEETSAEETEEETSEAETAAAAK